MLRGIGNLNAWTRQVGRRQVSSITLAGAHVGIYRARSLRATTTGSTGHRDRCSHCPTTEEKQHAIAASSDVEKTKVQALALEPQRTRLYSRDESKPPARVCPGDSRGKMWPPQGPTSSLRRPIGRALGAGFDRRLMALRKDATTGREEAHTFCSRRRRSSEDEKMLLK